MIGRGTTIRLAEAAQARFSAANGPGRGRWVPWDAVHDFFYGWGFDAQFCKAIEQAARNGERRFTEFILGLQTGDSVGQLRETYVAEPEVEGQALLRKFAQALLADFEQSPTLRRDVSAQTANALAQAFRRLRQLSIDALKSALELDGFGWIDGALIHRDSTPIDTEKQRDLLVVKAAEIGLAGQDLFSHALRRSADAYQSGNWEDCVGNARKALELVLRECAVLHSARTGGVGLTQSDLDRPYKVRDYFRDEGLLEVKEHEALGTNYGLLSEVGNHPYIAQREQARMLRQIALILTEFVLVRTEGALKTRAGFDK
jgi:hypothetical protein